MPLLVEGLCPQLTSSVINQCKNIGILTVAAFVTTNTEELAKKSKIAFKDLVCIRHFLLTNYAGFPQRADSLYNMLLESIYIISSGSKRINNFLKGGIYTGEVTEIHGPPGSGKTQFCLSAAANLVIDSENTAFYLDTNSNFAAGRIEQILLKKCEDKLASDEKISFIDVYTYFENTTESSESKVTGKILGQIVSEKLKHLHIDLNRFISIGTDGCSIMISERIGAIVGNQMVVEKLQKIKVVNVRDIYHLFDVLDSIKCELSKMENEFFMHLKLIAIDSVTHLLSPCFGGKYLDGPAFMSNLAQLFKIVCSEHMVSILVSNNTVQSADCDIKASLGPSWKYVPSVSLCIRKMNTTKLRKLTAVKSCRNGLHHEILFSINEAGITD